MGHVSVNNINSISDSLLSFVLDLYLMPKLLAAVLRCNCLLFSSCYSLFSLVANSCFVGVRCFTLCEGCGLLCKILIENFIRSKSTGKGKCVRSYCTRVL